MQPTIQTLLHQLIIAVPVVIVATQTLTSAINGIFKIETANARHLMSWIIAVLCGIGFVAFNGLDFGVSIGWNYVLGGVTGIVAGGAANGFYDWPSIKAFFTAIENMFNPIKGSK